MHKPNRTKSSVAQAITKPQFISRTRRSDSIKEASTITSLPYSERPEINAAAKESPKFEPKSVSKIFKENKRNIAFTNIIKTESKSDSPSAFRAVADNQSKVKADSRADSSSDDSERELQIVEEVTDNQVQSVQVKEEEVSKSTAIRIPPSSAVRTNRNSSEVRLEPIKHSISAISATNIGDTQNVNNSPEVSANSLSSTFRGTTSNATLHDNNNQNSLSTKMSTSHVPHSVQNVITSNSAFTTAGAQSAYLSRTVSNSTTRSSDRNDSALVISGSQSRSENENAAATSPIERGNLQASGNQGTGTTLYLQGSPISALRYPGANIVPPGYHLNSSGAYPTVPGTTSQTIPSAPHIAPGMNNLVLVDRRNIPVIAVTLPQTTDTAITGPKATVSTLSFQPSITSAAATSTAVSPYETEATAVTGVSPVESPQTIRQPNLVTNSSVCPSRPSILRKRCSDGSRKTTPTKELSAVISSNSDAPTSNTLPSRATACAVNPASVIVSSEKSAKSNVSEVAEVQTITPRKKPRKQAVVPTEDKYASNLPSDSSDSSETDIGEEITDLNDDTSVAAAIVQTETPQIQKSDKPRLEYEQLVMLRNKKRTPILNSFKCNSKAAHNHFQRYSDVKRRDEKHTNLSEICSQRDILRRLHGWKVLYLTAQLEDMAKVEQSIHSKIYRLQECLSTYRHGRNSKGEDFSMMYELLQGNIQRCRLVIEQVEEVKTSMLKILEHKNLGVELLKKYMEKRQMKKKA
ncbi:Histone deacetylase complex subunit SAP130-A [Trichoplax sp. H2]|nr:Histone deacetylase complex subunit SAP130-A [Trichoplax sp. H2]|eukprot:RDD36643.1 Histone deacetylase complex subunit SAP130-A [Trichoplax sp. H2]